MSAVSADPKKVLQLINDMGYKNVSATELKAFTKGKFFVEQYQLHFNCISVCRFEKIDEIRAGKEKENNYL